MYGKMVGDAALKLHASGEDYLEAVLILQKQKGMVRSVDLARHMGYAKQMCIRDSSCGSAYFSHNSFGC